MKQLKNMNKVHKTKNKVHNTKNLNTKSKRSFLRTQTKCTLSFFMI